MSNSNDSAELNDEYLLSAAQNMEELIFTKGAVIIQQDDIGDSVCGHSS
jgi:CRP-like cAMP-binding protein